MHSGWGLAWEPWWHRKSGENPIFGLFFSYFRSGTFFGTYSVSYFGPKARNLFSSRPNQDRIGLVDPLAWVGDFQPAGIQKERGLGGFDRCDSRHELRNHTGTCFQMMMSSFGVFDCHWAWMTSLWSKAHPLWNMRRKRLWQALSWLWYV